MIKPGLSSAEALRQAAALRQSNQLDASLAAYEAILQDNPDSVQACFEYGDLLKRRGRLTEAADYLHKAIELDAGHAAAWSSLGGVYRLTGRQRESSHYYRRAVELSPDNAYLHSNLLMSQLYTDPEADDALFNSSVTWANRYTAGLPRYGDHENGRQPGRPLRIGYVSNDFRRHPVAFFIIPVIATHNRQNFELFAYSLCDAPDDPVNKVLRGMVPNWRDVASLGDEQLARQIIADRIDILVDLAGHTGSHRLRVFARKPAPLQVSWLGYPATTGLSEMDYRITDAWADPEGQTEACHSETLLRLPNGFSCFHPASEAPAVAPAPQRRNGYVTFGSLNNMAKITGEVIAVWAKVLNGLPTSRLLLKNHSLTDAGVRKHCVDRFASYGIAGDRLLLQPTVADYAAHLATYNAIDVGLDTFPYNGTTTTCEALWMGVPVVTVAGKSHVSRVGVSLLSRLGLPQLIAGDTEEYVDIAIRLAAESAAQRPQLRQRMMASSICQAPAFTQSLEAAFRGIWTRWCNGRS